MSAGYPNPLLASDSPLDSAARELVEEVNRAEQARTHSHAEQDRADPARRARVELTRAELWDQPTAIRTTLSAERSAITQLAERIGSRPLERAYLIGCGDSLGAALAVRALYERVLGIPTEPMQALDFARYGYRMVDARSLVIGLSSSGTTARVVEGLLVARALGAQTLGVSNTAGSPVLEAAENVLLVHATRRGWPTQSTTAAMAALFRLAFDLGRSRGGQPDALAQLEDALARAPEDIELVLREQDQGLNALAERLVSRDLFLYAGGGPAYACALFGAAKMKECSLAHAIAIPLEEYHHYVSQRDGDVLFLVAPAGAALQRALDTARSGRIWGGAVYAAVTRGDELLKENVDVAFELPAVDELLAPIVYSVPVQLFAYHLAMAQFRQLSA